MITKKEATRKLFFDSLLKYRETHRIFGNIDNQFKFLGASESIELVMIKVDFFNKTRNIFEKNDAFYAAIMRKK